MKSMRYSRKRLDKMTMQRDWLWDRKISLKAARRILRDPEDKRFLSLASLLFSRKNTPKEVFRFYIKKFDFLRNWKRIKSKMRKDYWNDPRIEFWEAVYEKLRQDYKEKGNYSLSKPKPEKPKSEFCRLVAEKIRALRKQKGLTQEDLAKKLRVSQQVISRIEKGRENISILTFKRIVDGLGAEIHLDIK